MVCVGKTAGCNCTENITSISSRNEIPPRNPKNGSESICDKHLGQDVGPGSSFDVTLTGQSMVTCPIDNHPSSCPLISVQNVEIKSSCHVCVPRTHQVCITPAC